MHARADATAPSESAVAEGPRVFAVVEKAFRLELVGSGKVRVV